MNTCEMSIPGSQCLATRARGGGSRLTRFLGLLETWHERSHQRRELLAMPDYLLKDMGVTREELYEEVRKPFWRP